MFDFHWIDFGSGSETVSLALGVGGVGGVGVGAHSRAVS